MSTWEQAEIDYMAGMKYREIAEKYGVSLNTVYSWQRRHGWQRKTGNKRGRKPAKAKDPSKVEKAHRKKRTEKNAHEDDPGEEKRKIINALVKVDGLKEKQRLFCLYYMRNHNATSSYQRAYGCTRAAAASAGWALLRNPEIKMAIRKMQAERDADLLLCAGDVVELYMRIAFADYSEFVTSQNGRLIVHDLDEVDAQLIQSVQPLKDGGFVVHLADRMKALQWLSDYFELNPRDGHKVEYQQKMAELRERELLSKEEGW